MKLSGKDALNYSPWNARLRHYCGETELAKYNTLHAEIILHTRTGNNKKNKKYTSQNTAVGLIDISQKVSAPFPSKNDFYFRHGKEKKNIPCRRTTTDALSIMRALLAKREAVAKRPTRKK